MKPFTPLLGLIVLLPLPVAAQTAPPQSETTIVLPDSGPASSTTPQAGNSDTTVTKSQTGNADTTITNVKRENGSTTTVITQQPQSTYQPMGQGGYQPMGR
jgi:hypothetical protein